MNGTNNASNTKNAKVQSNASVAANNGSTRTTNGDVSSNGTNKAKKAPGPPINSSEVHELVQSRIAALEGEKVQGGEEDRRSAEEARKTLKGMNLQQLHTKYVELYQDFRRQEREHAKERQKNKKESDASKTALTNVQKLKSKTDAVVRDMQKQNKDLREESKRIKNSLHQAELQLLAAKEEIQKKLDREKKKEKRYAEMPDIVIKVVCRYRAELFFKISRKTKLARLFTAWTERMDARSYPSAPSDSKSGDMLPKINVATPAMQFLFTHMGRSLESDQTPEDAGMEDGDEILAVEMMDLTGPEVDEIPKQERARIQKNWSLDPVEARNSIEGIFDGIVRERLKNVLRQYELREKHFDVIMRSKELELLLAKARSHELQTEREREADTLTALHQQNEDLLSKIEDMQTSHQELAYQFELCAAEFLAASKAKGSESQESAKRALQMYEELHNQISAQFAVPDTDSEGSEGDPETAE